MKSIFASKTFWLAVLSIATAGLNESQKWVTGDTLNWVTMIYGILSIVLRFATKKEVKMKVKPKVLCLLILILGLFAITPSAMAETTQPKLAWNIAFDSTERAELLGSYTAYEIKNFDFLGLKTNDKVTIQLWAFGGLTTDTTSSTNNVAFTGGGAFVLHMKAADNLYFNAGPKLEFRNEKAVWKLLFGISIY